MLIEVGSLFSGVGGIELGFEREGFKTKWFVEREPYCQAVLKKNFPNVPIYDDITKIKWGEVPKVDVLTGGFPCQDISNAGKRKGITGEKSSLWKEFARAISVLRPRFVVIENVSALLGRGLDTVLCDLAALGYDAEWHCITASSVGAPHRRDRIFILAYPNCDGKVEQGRVGHDEKRNSETQVQEWRDEQSGLNGTSLNEREVANTLCCGCGSGVRQIRGKQSAFKELVLAEKGRLREFRETIGRAQWQTEPRLDRLVNGVPTGMESRIWRERIKGLGNGVVPQVAQFVARMVKRRAGWSL